MTVITAFISEEFASRFLDKVINFGNNQRQKYFFNEFLKAYPKELESGHETITLDELFKKIEASEEMKEMLFEVYRKVCLSASKSLGPKIMGILVSKICFEERIANNIEELIFEACEILNDRELREIVQLKDSIKWLGPLGGGELGQISHNIINESFNGNKQVIESYINVIAGKYDYEFDLETITTPTNADYQEKITPPSLEYYFGRWAIKLRNIDILLEHTREEYKHQVIGPSNSKTDRNFTVTINKEFFDKIIPLINRATGPNI